MFWLVLIFFFLKKTWLITIAFVAIVLIYDCWGFGSDCGVTCENRFTSISQLFVSSHYSFLVCLLALIPLSMSFLMLFLSILILSLLTPQKPLLYAITYLSRVISIGRRSSVIFSFISRVSLNKHKFVYSLFRLNFVNYNFVVTILYWGVTPIFFWKHYRLCRFTMNMVIHKKLNLLLVIDRYILLWFG